MNFAQFVVVGTDELREVHGADILDIGHHELPLAAPLHVHGQAQIDLPRNHVLRLALVVVAKGGVHVAKLLKPLHHRMGDQVRKRDLLAAHLPLVVVQQRAVLNHQLHGDGAHGGGRRDAEALLHVVDHLRARPANRIGGLVLSAAGRGRGGLKRAHGAVLLRRRSGRGLLLLLRRRLAVAARLVLAALLLLLGRSAVAGGLRLLFGRLPRLRHLCYDGRLVGVIVLKEVAPALAHALRVFAVLLVNLVNVAGVEAETAHGM